MSKWRFPSNDYGEKKGINDSGTIRKSAPKPSKMKLPKLFLPQKSKPSQRYLPGASR